MGQAANSKRNASLDDQKRRAAGRQGQQSPENEAIRDFQSEQAAKGRTGGAYGRDEVANRQARGAGEGGGSTDPRSELPEVSRSARRTRKR